MSFLNFIADLLFTHCFYKSSCFLSGSCFLVGWLDRSIDRWMYRWIGGWMGECVGRLFDCLFGWFVCLLFACDLFNIFEMQKNILYE